MVDLGKFKKGLSKAAAPTGLLSSASQAVGMLSNLYGSFSGYGHEHRDDCEGVSLALLLTTFAAIGVVFFAVFTKLTMIINGRKKRAAPEDDEDTLALILDNINFLFYEGTND